MDELVEQILAASFREEVRAAVQGVYAQVAAEVERRRPRCELSGRCCRFEEYGHRLYVTSLELAAFVHDLRKEGRQVGSWDGRGCPFQRGKLCTVHAFRPFGCRMFYCDPTAEEWQNEMYERFHGELKGLHEAMGVAYAYLEWREGLGLLGLARAG